MKTLVLLFLLVAAPAFAQHAAHPDLVATVTAQLRAQGADLSGACGAFAITKRVAWLLQGEGVGLLSKPAGNNCEGYAVDYLVYQDGIGVDILQDAGGQNGATWQADFDAALLGRWRAPVDPGGSPVPPVVVPPVPPVVVTPPVNLDQLMRAQRIENNTQQLLAAVAEVKAITTETREDVKDLRSTAGAIGHFLLERALPVLAGVVATWQVTK